MPDLLYRLNAHDQISSVSEEWLSFAEANEGRSLLPPDILGRPLWDFIADHDTQHIYDALHQRVRTRRWLEVEEAVEALRLFAEPLPPQITHGICFECSEGIHQALDGDLDNLVLGGL